MLHLYWGDQERETEENAKLNKFKCKIKFRPSQRQHTPFCWIIHYTLPESHFQGLVREDHTHIISGSFQNSFSHISLFLMYINTCSSFLTCTATGTKPTPFTCSYTPTNSLTEMHIVSLETLLKIWGKKFTGRGDTCLCPLTSSLPPCSLHPRSNKVFPLPHGEQFFENQFPP